MSELKKRGDNAFARSAIDYEFISLTTRNAVGEVVYDCETEVTAYSVLMNIQASYMEKFILSFLTNHGCDLEKFWQEKEHYFRCRAFECTHFRQHQKAEHNHAQMTRRTR